MKKVLSLILVCIIAFGFSAMAFADVAVEPSLPVLQLPELPDYSGTYYVDNPEGAKTYAGTELIPTGEVIPYGGKIDVVVGYQDVNTVYLVGTYKGYQAVIISAEDVGTRALKPLEFDNPTIDCFAYDYIEVTYKETSALGTIKSGLVFASSDEDVVTVDKDGNVTATGEGTAYVKAIDPASGEYDVIEVEVTYTWWQKLIRIFLLGFLWY